MDRLRAWHLAVVAAAVALANGGCSPSPSGPLQQGDADREKKDYDKAVADYTDAIRLDPKCVAAFNNRGSAWEAKGEYDKAIQDFDDAIRLDPKDAAAFNNRGNA
jgi:tetratricopeptide (TPR) repeat protein